MEFDKDFIGKVVLGNKSGDWIIAGYDGIREVYLAIPLYSLSKAYHRLYSLDAVVSYDEVINNINEKLEFFEEVEKIISEKRKYIYFSHDDLDLEKIFRRIKECHINLENNKRYLKSMKNTSNEETYKKEVNNSTKGLKRAFKRLYSVFEEDDYYTLMEYLEDYNYSFDNLDIKISRLKEKKKKFIEGYKDTVEHIKTTIV